jgi:hypothetical protein
MVNGASNLHRHNFGLTTAASAIAWPRGTNQEEPALTPQLIVAVSMFVPILAALIVRTLRREGFEDVVLKIGPKRLYLQAYAVVLIAFILAYGLNSAFISRPDLTIPTFTQIYGLPATDNPGLILLSLAAVTLTVAPPDQLHTCLWQGVRVEGPSFAKIYDTR